MIVQLNNTNNGKVVRLKSVTGNRIDFLRYDYDTQVINTGTRFAVIPNLTDYLYEQAKIVLGPNFVVDETGVNWIFASQSKFIRMFISANLFSQEAFTNSAFFQLIQQFKIDYASSYRFHTDMYLTVIYVDMISTANKAILNPRVIDGQMIVEQLVDGVVIRIMDLNDLA